jgi:hypothetical protein
LSAACLVHYEVNCPDDANRDFYLRGRSDYTTHDKSVTKYRHRLMPTRRFTKSMVAAAILGFEEKKRQIDIEIAALRAMDSGTEPASSKSPTAPAKRTKRKMSAATRKAMALAQQKRWAAKKAASEPDANAATKPKRKLSAAGKKRIIAASKRYWAEKRAAAKKSS